MAGKLSSKGVAQLVLSNPPVNGLNRALRQFLIGSVEAWHGSGAKAKAVVIVGGGSTFPAGADIAEFESGKWEDDPDLVKVVDFLDRSKIPLIAAIHGTALGGGLEVALACHYRVALPSAKMGLPEVHLGILPGAGGTQRLPRVVGIEKSLEMMTSGKPINAKQAKEWGLVDELIEGKDENDLLQGALKFAESILEKREDLQSRRISQKPAPSADESVYESTFKTVSKQLRGQIAPLRIIDAVKACSNSTSFAQGMKAESEIFQQLMAGPQAKGLQHMFFAERNCSKVPNVDQKLARDVKHVGIIGAGTMGRGIAMCFMNKGLNVTLCEVKEDALAAGVNGIESLYKKSSAFRSGKMSETDLKAKMSLLNGVVDSDFDSLKDCDAVIEAVFENMDLKKSIFAKLGEKCREDAILCTNTSYLDIDEIAQASGRPESVLGTHFFSPANIMPLLENVRGAKSSDTTIATGMKMGKALGKTAVLVGNCFGFIGNRMFEAYTQEAILLLEEGATPSQVDKVLGPDPNQYGMAMGPLAVFDLAGNDIGYRIRREAYYPHTPENVQGSRGGTWIKLADELCNMGRYGQKTGKGWYSYDGRKAMEDPEVAKLCEEHRAKYGIENRSDISDQEILERCLYSMINEGFHILDEGIALRSSDIDVVWCNGYGFPRYRGGPMHYAEHIGLDHIYNTLRKYREQRPDLPAWHFEPSPLLENMARAISDSKQAPLSEFARFRTK